MPPDESVKLTFETEPDDWPLAEPIVLRDSVATFVSQELRHEQDARFLRALKLGECYYGARDCRIYPFACDLRPKGKLPTGRDIVTAVKARQFRSRHIVSLDVPYIPFPGYHPGGDNDEVHNDFPEQFVFSHEDDVDEMSGAHGDLKRYVVDGRLWYVLLHTTPRPFGEFMFSEFVILFVLGQSPHGDQCVGVVTHQVCHNLCD